MQGQGLAPLQTLYFGGGTPSLLSLKTLAALIEGVGARWGFADAPQITLEVHPTHADRAKFTAFRDAGVTRVSVGVQSFDDAALAFLGRQHSGAEAQATVAAARETFAAVNLDLITALPDMTLADQRRQIDTALQLDVDHLSVYSLGIEPGTAFGAAVQRGDWTPMGADLAADHFLAAIEQISAAGLPAYEVSNFARPGAESRHSVLGWQGAGYLGIGPGAEGRALGIDGIWRQRRTRKSPNGYRNQIAERGHGLEVDLALTRQDRAVEQLIFGLRLTEGLPRASAAWSITPPERWRTLLSSGDLEQTATHRRATVQGRLRLDALTDYLVNHER